MQLAQYTRILQMSHLRGRRNWVTYAWTIRGRWGKLHVVVAACGSTVPGLKNIHDPDLIRLMLAPSV